MPKLLDKSQIQRAVQKLGKALNRHYRRVASTGEPITFVCVLKGGGVFYHQLIQELLFDHRCVYLCASSYGSNTTSSGKVKVNLLKDSDQQYLKEHHVVVVDDIFDSGLTLQHLHSYLNDSFQPLSLRLCVLLYKNIPRGDVRIFPDYAGIEIGNQYVFGGGMDLGGESMRGLPHIYALDPNGHSDFQYPQQWTLRHRRCQVADECIRFVVVFMLFFYLEMLHFYLNNAQH